MATVVVYDKTRMQEIEDTTVVAGSVNNMGSLILATRAGVQIDAGNVIGPKGDQGLQGLTGPNGIDGIPGGTTAQRDAHYGVPTTDAQRVALANKAPVWHNAGNGKLETYYAVTGTSGLTVPGLAVGSTAGWYETLRYRAERHMTLTSAPFAWSGGSLSWDAGPLAIDSAVGSSAFRESANIVNFVEPGSTSGSLKFLEVGTYDVYWYNAANANPGNSAYRISAVGSWPGPLDVSWSSLGQSLHNVNDLFWETLVYAPAIRVPATGLEIRLTGLQTAGTTNTPKVKVIKRGGLN